MATKLNCDNLSNNCKWVGELGYLEEHLTTCDYSKLPCDNKCTENNETLKVLRKDLNDHLANHCPRRQYQCPHCKEEGEHQERTTTHLDTCPQVKIPCPNSKSCCSGLIPRCEVSVHRSTNCQYEPVPCKYAAVGCMETPLRKEIEQHDTNDQVHLRVTIDQVLKLTNKNANLTKTTTELTKKNADLEKKLNQLEQATPSKPLSTFKLYHFQQHKKASDSFYSDPFYTSPRGYKLRMRVDANGIGAHVSIYACLMKGNHDDTLTWPFLGTATFKLLNQLEDENHYKATIGFKDNELSKRTVKGDGGVDGRGFHKYIPHTSLEHDPTKNCQYLKDDILFFQVVICDPNYKPWLD